MLVPLFPRVTGTKTENAWGRGSRGMVRCTARLTRPLRAAESERISRLLQTPIDGTEVIHECRPEEIEEWHTRLVEALSGAWAPAPVAARGEDERSRPRKGNASAFRRRDQ